MTAYKRHYSIWDVLERLKEKSDADLLLIDRKEERVFPIQLVAATLLAEVNADETGRFELYEKVEVADDPAESV